MVIILKQLNQEGSEIGAAGAWIIDIVEDSAETAGKGRLIGG
jgi:hypothetical protein